MAKKKVATKKEKEWMRKVAELGCYACDVNGIENYAEVHHIRKHTGMGLRPSHFDTIPLCSRHHRTNKDSIHLGKKLFIQKYGTEQDILKIVKRRINNE
tara:strand:+ start:70 stop:366 length:297 start_codon:yes stop_codon:yes gene_type:complete